MTVEVPEPPDGSRIEFESDTDVYAAWRDDEDSLRAGYSTTQGWCVYGETVPCTWDEMIERFGAESLRLAVRLSRHPDDIAKAAQWPTAIWAGTGKAYAPLRPRRPRVARQPKPPAPTAAPADDSGHRGWNELRTSGLLWLINRVVFHPRGWALALVRQDGQIVGWRLNGDGREIWSFNDPEDDSFAAAQATLTPREAS